MSHETTMIPLETAITVGSAIAGALVLAVAALWRDSAKWRERWSEEVRARRKDSETFLLALKKRRGENSDLPPSS